MKRIGFIGIGIMGESMARNLMKAGYHVSVYTRTKQKAQALVNEGAIWCDSIKECVAGQDAILTIVGYPKDVEEVYFSEEGILSVAKSGTYVIDMTTTSPQLAKRIYEKSKEKGIISLDAPVTGGDIGAKNGTLSILVGGEEEAFQTCMPIFEAMGTNIVYEGEASSGQHTKMCNQIAIAGSLAGACEALVYAKSHNLDLKKVMASISAGAAGSFQLSNVASRAISNDWDPGFFVKHFIKDMGLALEEAELAEVNLGVLSYVYQMCIQLQDEGMGDMGTQVLVKYYQW